MFTAIVLLWLGVSIASSTTADRQSASRMSAHRHPPSSPSRRRCLASLLTVNCCPRWAKRLSHGLIAHRGPHSWCYCSCSEASSPTRVQLLPRRPASSAVAAPSSIVCGLLNARSVVNKAAGRDPRRHRRQQAGRPSTH